VNTYELNKVAKYIKNWSQDGAILVYVLSFGRLKLEPFDPKPVASVPRARDSLAYAADLITNIAINNAIVVRAAYQGEGKPIPPIMRHGSEDLLVCSGRWLQLITAILSGVLCVLGEAPLEQPLLNSPEESEERIAAEIKERLLHLAWDVYKFAQTVPFAPPPEEPPKQNPDAPPIDHSLDVLESQLQKLTVDYLYIARAMPYHVPSSGRKKRDDPAKRESALQKSPPVARKEDALRKNHDKTRK
jgi:hypothetical protein